MAELRLICVVMADTRVSTLAAAAKPADRQDRPREELRLAETAPSFEQLVARHQQRVARLCYRLLGWREDVEDAVQEVFLAALGALPDFRGQSSVSTWLTRITVNTCRGYLRKRVLRLRLFARPRRSFEPRSDRPAERQLMDCERFDRVRRAVRKLPPKYREVIVLRYLEEMAVPAIADVLELSRNAVEVRLNRARKRLKEDLTELLEG